MPPKKDFKKFESKLKKEAKKETKKEAKRKEDRVGGFSNEPRPVKVNFSKKQNKEMEKRLQTDKQFEKASKKRSKELNELRTSELGEDVAKPGIYYRATRVPSGGYGTKLDPTKSDSPEVPDPAKEGYKGTPNPSSMNNFFKPSVYMAKTPRGAHNFILETKHNAGYKWEVHQIEKPAKVIQVGGLKGKAKEGMITKTAKSMRDQYKFREDPTWNRIVTQAESDPIQKKVVAGAFKKGAKAYLDNVAVHNQEHVSPPIPASKVKLYKVYDYRGDAGRRKFNKHPDKDMVQKGIETWRRAMEFGDVLAKASAKSKQPKPAKPTRAPPKPKPVAKPRPDFTFKLDPDR